MPQSHVYIGDMTGRHLRKSLKPGEIETGDAVCAITRVLPPVCDQFYGGLGILMNKISKGELYGKQVDSACWVAVVTPRDIMKFIDELYDEWVQSQSKGFNNFGRRLDEVVAMIKELDRRRKYALVGYEMY
ncbi:MAG: hypothetical protein P4N59_17380 [Negativicutes bacterium]|nr:hypothetical protein [Negativicutes bacterium]